MSVVIVYNHVLAYQHHHFVHNVVNEETQDFPHKHARENLAMNSNLVY